MKQQEGMIHLKQEENMHRDMLDATCSSSLNSCSWSKLSSDLLSEILRRLPSDDYLRFSAVCTSWHSAAEKRRHLPAPQLPWLMIPMHDTAEEVIFLSLSNCQKLYVPLPTDVGDICHNFIGSSCGWLITNDIFGGIMMFNPLSKKEIHLPPLTTFPDISITDAHLYPEFKDQTDDTIVIYDPASYGGVPTCPHDVTSVWILSRFYIRKAIIIPTCPNRLATLVDGYTVVVVIDHGRLAIVRDDDTSWTILNPQYSFRERPYFNEIAYIDGVVYALSDIGKLISWDISTMTMKELCPKLLENPEFLGTLFNLVELDGDLLVVDRYTKTKSWEKGAKTYLVKIHKFNWLTKSWDKVKSLGHYSIFVGINQPLSFSTLDFPELKKNCIYFTENDQYIINGRQEMKRNMGVFDLKKQKMIEQFEGYDDELTWPLPLWLYPNVIDEK